MSHDAFAQPGNFNKLSKVEKCASGGLPPSACKKVSDRTQANSGGIGAGQTNVDTVTTMGGNGDGVGTASSATSDSNSVNLSINPNQQSTHLCVTGNIEALPHRQHYGLN